jgi:class 3 adenylate cyclase
VFTLLETIYGAFDAIARRRGVYKVETIGDSYVAVTGLPVPRQDHAVVLSRFARDCREQMAEVTRRLDKTLGPDTSTLKVRYTPLRAASCSRSCCSQPLQFFAHAASVRLEQRPRYRRRAPGRARTVPGTAHESVVRSPGGEYSGIILSLHVLALRSCLATP